MANPSKRLLLFTNKLGYQTRSFEAAARDNDTELIYVTDRCHQLEDPWGDHAIAVHFEAAQAAAATVVEKVRGATIDGLLALGDSPVVTAAYVARDLSLPYNHPASVTACRSKLRLREIFRDAGLPTPWFRVLPLDPLPEPALHGIQYPCVLKPLSLSASRGVIRANNRDEFAAAAIRIRKLLSSAELRSTREENLDRILVEGYITGKEVAVEGLVRDGVLRTLAIFDKPDPLEGPYFEETIYVTPSRLTELQQRAVQKCAVDCARAVGLTHGPVHAEFRVNFGEVNSLPGAAGSGSPVTLEPVWPLEIAARPIGGLCAQSLCFTDDRDAQDGSAVRSKTIGLEELLLRHALGLPGSDLVREHQASAVMMIPVPRSGIFQQVQGEDAARATPGIAQLIITARLHDYIEAWPEGSSYLGFLFSKGASPEAAEKALRQAHAELHFILAPRLPVKTSASQP